MRCILTVNFSPWSRYSGGGQRSTHNLACALARRGHRVSVVFTKAPWQRVPLPAELPYDAVWAVLPGARRGSPPFVREQVRRLVEASSMPRETVVHSNGEESALVASLRHGRNPQRFAFVVTPRYPNFPPVLRLEAAQRSSLSLALLTVTQTKYVWLGRALRSADWVCPTSRSAAEMVQRAYDLDPARMTVVANGISDEFLQQGSGAPSELPADAALREFTARGDFAVYFGRLAQEKGVHTLLDALESDACRATRIVFAGRGPELLRLRARAEQPKLRGRILFTTWLDAAQLAALVSRASFAVLPSLEESFGNTMAEAMALAVPVISTTAGSIPELIRHGETGLLVPPGDAAALAEAIRSLAGDGEQRRTLGTAGRAHAAQHFTWGASAERFERLYERLLADAPATR